MPLVASPKTAEKRPPCLCACVRVCVRACARARARVCVCDSVALPWHVQVISSYSYKAMEVTKISEKQLGIRGYLAPAAVGENDVGE
jgi:hypothetical protein